jgi:SAM-dependent methyltransferase/uncharacterized protein YbaR (Trm112 family)
MIATDLLAVLACPVCLESSGCERCARASDHAASCIRDYVQRTRCACGGPDKVALRAREKTLCCPCCGTEYPLNEEGGYADLRPRWERGAQTHYADRDFHERLRIRDAPPVLSAGVKAETTRRLLEIGKEDSVLDLGCGAGKFALFYAALARRTVGVDVAPYFLPRARAQVVLVVADLRRLPFRKQTFSRAYSLDVLEHLDEGGVLDLLCEARRTLAPQGRLCVYTHAMESSRLAAFQRGVNRLARVFERFGWIDLKRERLRKSDHVNAIRSHEHFDALCSAAGLVVRRRRYYNVVFKAAIEDLLIRFFERMRRRRRAEAALAVGEQPVYSGTLPPGRASLLIARALTRLLMLDVILFAKIRTGPFFGLLEPSLPHVRDARTPGEAATEARGA